MMKAKDAYDSNERGFLKVTDLDNEFNVFADYRNNYVYNLNQTVYFDIDSDSLPEYVIKTPSHWTLISYNIYGTTRLAWLLMKINNVSAKETFRQLQPGETVKYVFSDSVQQIVRSINGYET